MHGAELARKAEGVDATAPERGGRARGRSVAELAVMVEDFEGTAAEVVRRGGGRVVKTVGDGVLFTAADPAAAAEIGLSLPLTQDRSQGFQDALSECGLDVDNRVAAEFTVESGEEVTANLLQEIGRAHV